MEPRVRFGPFELDSARGILTRDGAPVSLGNRALSLLQVLVRARGNVVTKDELIEDITQDGAAGFLKKPYGREALARALARALGVT